MGNDTLRGWFRVDDEPLLSSRQSGTLIIACQDPGLDTILGKFASQGAIVWRTPGNQAFLSSGLERRTLDELLREGLDEILVLGHSRCDWLRARQPQQGIASEAAEGVNRIFRNVRQAGTLRSCAMRHVLNQLQSLRRRPEILDATIFTGLTLRGLLYLDETGLFLDYDEDEARFVPLRDEA